MNTHDENPTAPAEKDLLPLAILLLIPVAVPIGCLAILWWCFMQAGIPELMLMLGMLGVASIGCMLWTTSRISRQIELGPAMRVVLFLAQLIATILTVGGTAVSFWSWP